MSLATPSRLVLSRLGSAKRQTLHIGKLDCLFLLFFPIIQLGHSVWVSVASLASLLLVWRWGKVMMAGLRDAPAFLLLVPLMYFSYAVNDTTDADHDFLFITRQALFFTLEVAFFYGARKFSFSLDEKFLEKIIFAIAIFFMALTALQFIMINRGIYIGFPKEYFAMDVNTIPGALDLRYSKVRPSGTLSEPSYMAFILLCLMMMNVTFYDFIGKNKWISAVILSCGLLTQSFSFVIFTFTLFAVSTFYMSAYAAHRINIFIVGTLAALILALFGSDVFFAERLAAGGSASGDISTFVRIFGPGAIIPEYLYNHPAGSLESGVRHALVPYTSIYAQDPDQFLMNAIYNQFFYYGLFGFGILYFCVRGLDIIFSIFLLLSFVFSGSVFDLDKFFCLCFTYLIHRHNLQFRVSRIDGGGVPNRANLKKSI